MLEPLLMAMQSSWLWMVLSSIVRSVVETSNPSLCAKVSFMYKPTSLGVCLRVVTGSLSARLAVGLITRSWNMCGEYKRAERI